VLGGRELSSGARRAAGGERQGPGQEGGSGSLAKAHAVDLIDLSGSLIDPGAK